MLRHVRQLVRLGLSVARQTKQELADELLALERQGIVTPRETRQILAAVRKEVHSEKGRVKKFLRQEAKRELKKARKFAKKLGKRGVKKAVRTAKRIVRGVRKRGKR